MIYDSCNILVLFRKYKAEVRFFKLVNCLFKSYNVNLKETHEKKDQNIFD